MLRCLNICLLLCCVLFLNTNVYATEALSQAQQKYRDQIQTILDDKAFNQTETRSGWRFKELSRDDDKIPQWLIDFVVWLERLEGSDVDIEETIATLALIIEVLLWVIFIGLIIYCVYRFRRVIANTLGIYKKTKPSALPVTVAGLDVSKESLPEDVIETAKTLWGQQQYRQALGLLYRASLSHLLHDFDCHLQSSFTEAECLQAAQGLPQPQLLELFRQLTNAWQQLAYAHLSPSQSQFDLFCQQWRQVFSPQSLEKVS